MRVAEVQDVFALLDQQCRAASVARERRLLRVRSPTIELDRVLAVNDKVQCPPRFSRRAEG